MSDGATEMLRDELTREDNYSHFSMSLKPMTSKHMEFVPTEITKRYAEFSKRCEERSKNIEGTVDSDAVYKPSHYQLLPWVEVIDVRQAILNQMNPTHQSLFAVDCWSRSWEYLTRMWGKNRLEDARKAKVYLEWLIEELEKEV